MRHLRLLLAGFVLIGLASPAFAIKPFYDVFKKEYLDSLKDKKFAESVDKGDSKCLICHQGKNKKNRNPFGNEVAKLLDRKKDAKDNAKIAASLKKALAVHVNPKDAKSETYLDRLNAGKWPGGDLAELKKEPKEEKKKD